MQDRIDGEQIPEPIRLADPSDAAAIASVLLESFVEYKPLYTPEGFAATTPTTEQLWDRMKEGPVWIAFIEGAVVGTVSVVAKNKALYIRGMAVLPGARGRQLGELLLSKVESFAAEHGFVRLFLSTTPFLDRAIRLYRKFGFVQTTAGPHDLFGTPLFTMEKTLTLKPD